MQLLLAILALTVVVTVTALALAVRHRRRAQARRDEDLARRAAHKAATLVLERLGAERWHPGR